MSGNNNKKGYSQEVKEMLTRQKERLEGEAKIVGDYMNKLKPEKQKSSEEREADKEKNTEQYNKLMGAGSKWREKKDEERENQSV